MVPKSATCHNPWSSSTEYSVSHEYNLFLHPSCTSIAKNYIHYGDIGYWYHHSQNPRIARSNSKYGKYMGFLSLEVT